jgi:signal transduction histidine kinase
VRYLRLTIRPLRIYPVALDRIVDDAYRASLAGFEGDAARLDRGELPVVWGDPSLLAECLSELITNARKFAVGPVGIRVEVDRTIAGWVYLQVCDDGPGIDPAFVEDAFEPFRLLQPKGRYPGVGMGLALCRRIVEVHAGRCWIEASERAGTTVRLRLPLAP